MENRQSNRFIHCGCTKNILLLQVFGVMLLPSSLNAFPFVNGELTGSLDTTISAGLRWRVQDRDPNLIDRHNGGNAQNALNGDDGDINFSKGLVSSAVKATHDLEMLYRNYGGFFRVSYFYDYTLSHKDELSEEAKDRVASDAELLDAYVFGRFSPDEKSLQLRIGQQVVSWGEGTFIANGINVINPIDVRKFRVPGAEVREALKPTPMFWGSLELSQQVNLEALYIVRFEHTEIDPRGSYFSTNDVVTDGSYSLVAGFGVADEDGNIPSIGVTDGRFIMPRAADQDAKDGGEYGAALRWFSPLLNNTEFGFYYLNYHSRLPLVNFIAGTPGQPPSSARYYVVYPEDIHLYGISFNSLLPAGGTALQGEISYRDNVPLQIEFAEAAMAATHTRTTGGDVASQLGTYNEGDVVQGYKRLSVGQVQLTATHSFGAHNWFKADQLVLLGEVGATKVLNMPAKEELRFEAPGTNLPARDDIAVAGQAIPQQQGGYADEFSWGYRLLGRWGYNNVVEAVNMSMLLAFAHDVQGTTPGPGGNFVENRKALTLGVGGEYMQSWSADLSYTRYFGAEAYNPIHDRDFVSLDIKYGF
jgi:hypothetical protein